MANIPIKQLEQMFQGMRSEAGWDTDRDLLWGYFFGSPLFRVGKGGRG